MNQERGEGTRSSSSSLMAIHPQVWGFLHDPSTKYKTILKTTHLPLIKCGRVNIWKPSFKVQCDYSNERQLFIWQQLWQDVLGSKQASRAESKDQQSKLGLCNKRQFVTTCCYCFSFGEYIAIKKGMKIVGNDRNSDCLSINILSLL